MILIEDAREIPELDLTDTSRFELQSVPEQYWRPLVNQSSPVKVISQGDEILLVGGLYRQSFISIPHLWALVSPKMRDIAPSTYRAIRRYCNTLFPGVETYINLEDAKAQRLARFFGFNPTGTSFTFEEVPYEIYRRPL